MSKAIVKYDYLLKKVNDNRLQDKSCTFMGHNQKLLHLLLCGYGIHLPEFLTHRSGVDIVLIYLMRPLIDSVRKIKSFCGLSK